MTWAEAQIAMKAGHKVRRPLWRSGGQFAFIDGRDRLMIKYSCEPMPEVWQPLYTSRNATDWEVVPNAS